jgi:hypothetical protein
MILCLWCNELLDHNHMDTYPMDVWEAIASFFMFEVPNWQLKLGKIL